MRLLIIYGAEASGKLTIAAEVARKTSFRLFHNHISVDVAKAVYEYGDEGFGELSWDVRELVFRHAARARRSGMIFTWAYSHPSFQPYLDRLTDIANREKIELLYVYVTCSLEDRKQRVSLPDRVAAGKIHTIADLDKQNSRKTYALIPDSNSFVINSSSLSPGESAESIITHFAIS